MAVELKQEEQWKVIHHFLWNEDPGFRGTEALQLYPVYREWNGGWIGEGELTGQVLYDKKGTSYAADYASMENTTYESGQSWPFYEQHLRGVLHAAAGRALPWICSLRHQGERGRLVDRFLAKLYAPEDGTPVSGDDSGPEPKTGHLAG